MTTRGPHAPTKAHYVYGVVHTCIPIYAWICTASENAMEPVTYTYIYLHGASNMDRNTHCHDSDSPDKFMSCQRKKQGTRSNNMSCPLYINTCRTVSARENYLLMCQIMEPLDGTNGTAWPHAFLSNCGCCLFFFFFSSNRFLFPRQFGLCPRERSSPS